MYIVSIICIFHECLEDCACETLISILRSSFTWSLNEANLVNSNVHTHNFPLNFCKWKFFSMCIWNSERKKLGLFILVHWTRLKPGTRVLGSLSPTWDGHSLSQVHGQEFLVWRTTAYNVPVFQQQQLDLLCCSSCFSC